MKNKTLFFTEHQLKRMAKRGISKSIIESVVRNGNWEKGSKHMSYEVEYRGIIVILYEQKNQYNIATCKLNRENTLLAEKLQNKQGIDFCKAMHKIVKGIDFA